MRFLHLFTPALALFTAGAAHAASSWGFEDATVSVIPKTKDVQLKKQYVLTFLFYFLFSLPQS